MKQRSNITDPQVQETDKRRFQRMRARNRFGKEYLSEIKQCVQKTDYLVNRPTPAKTQRKTVGSPIKKRTKKIEKKVDEDDLYPHVKFVIHPRIQQHKIPKFLNNQNLQQHSKTKAPPNEEQDYNKRSLSSSDQPKDRYNLSTLSSTNVSDSNSSNAEIHDEVPHNSNVQNNSPINGQNDINSSDSFDDSAHLASLNNEKPKKEVKKQPDYSDYSDSETTIPKKPGWKFSDSERRGKSSAISSNDFRWNKNSSINQISSSSDSDVDIEKIKEEMKKDIEQEESENPKSLNPIFFGSESLELPKEDRYSLKNKKGNNTESDLSASIENHNSSSKIDKITIDSKNASNEVKSSDNDHNDNYQNSSNEDNRNEEEETKFRNDIKIPNKREIFDKNKSENEEMHNSIKEPEIDSDFEDFRISNKKISNQNKHIENNSDYEEDDMQIPNVKSQSDEQYSSDYLRSREKNKLNSYSKAHQYSSDFNSNDNVLNLNFNSQNAGKNARFASQYSTSGSSRGIPEEKKIRSEEHYKSNEFSSDEYRFNGDKNSINQNVSFDEEESDNEKIEQNSYVDSISSSKLEKDRISPELEKSLLNSNNNNSHKHFVETLSDGYDEDDENNHVLQNKVSKPQKINDSSSSSAAAKEVDIPVSAEGEVDNPFNFASSTSESAPMKKKQIEIDNNIDDDDDNSDIGFGNEKDVFCDGKDTSSSEDYNVEATTDTRENEIRENRKLDRRIYSGDQK
ncbi:hypothetical protein M9Y10_001166 [Tritrichomonas musculus]|uniref:Uncharacterized protein n=1 Tax=Tritrichomonas musculus TaxID=1915356 RepID=A0ABR2L698_9EUKA